MNNYVASCAITSSIAAEEGLKAIRKNSNLSIAGKKGCLGHAINTRKSLGGKVIDTEK